MQVISKLLHHSHTYSPSRSGFFLSFSEISELCADSQSIISGKSILEIHVHTPQHTAPA